jgi:cation diffusion facilitator CzcD-associated flavoprotein CzcO
MAPRVPPNPDTLAIDDYRPMKVICIGAGMSGILVGSTFPQKIPNLELVIYEKNTDVGGTWFENHYPGLRPDLTPHTYQYSFASNPNWSRFYPPGPEFEEYLREVSRKYDVYKNTKFGHRFQSAKWHQDLGQWEVQVLRLSDNTVIKDFAEVLIKATGFVNDWRWPDVPGREEFQGKMLHTANWDDNFDPTGKTVAVLGYGSTGVQVTPAIQPIVKKLDHYVRGKTWVPPGGGTCGEELLERKAHINFDHGLEERRNYVENPLVYLEYRKKMEFYTNSVQKFFFLGSPALDFFTQMIDQNMIETTKSKPELYKMLKPDYPPGCRRLIMGQGWLECLTQPNANLIPKDVKRFTKTGIEDVDGVHREYDAIICATGFDHNHDTRDTPFIGKDGTLLSDVWNPDPTAYFGVNPDKMPNLFLMFGPNSAPFSGSIVHTFEASAAYIVKCVKKLQQEYLKSMVCKPQALKNWVKHVDRHMNKTTFSSNCVTWFKRNDPKGRVITSWPGSAMNMYKGTDNPRFEDFEYESWLPEDDTMAWLGNGNTVAELSDDIASTNYIDYTDVSKILLVPGKGIEKADLKLSGEMNGTNGIKCETNGTDPKVLKDGVPPAATPPEELSTTDNRPRTDSKMGAEEDFMGTKNGAVPTPPKAEKVLENEKTPLIQGELKSLRANI